MITLFGIKNCDTMKKTQKWLTNHSVEFNFHDYRKDGIDAGWLEQVINELGWETVLNKRGTTFRKLPDELKQDLDAHKAHGLMLEHPAMIKRPIIQTSSEFLVGYNKSLFQEKLNAA